MDCERVIELLPWYRNRTLDREEAEAVGRHLESCGRCRQELADSDFALSVALTHLPAEVLVARAEGAASSMDPARVDAHLAVCERCAEELAMIEDGRATVETLWGADVVPFRRPEAPLKTRPDRGVSRAWRWATIAATVLVALFAGTDWIQRSEVERLSATLAACASASSGPATEISARANPIVESLYPVSTVLRGDAAEAPAIRLGDDAGYLALLLVPPPDLDAPGPFAVEIVDVDGGVVERVEGLRLQEAGDLGLLLPASVIPGPTLELRLLARTETGEVVVATYRRAIEG